MKRISKVTAVGLLICFVAATAAGCGKSGNRLLDTAMGKANSAKNLEAEAAVDMAMSTSVQGQTQDVDMKYTMNMSVFQEPLKMKADVNIDMGSMAMNMEMYSTEHEGEYVQYMNLGQLGGWVKQVICKTDDMKTAQEKINQLDAKMFMNSEYKYKEQPDETENDKTYKVYSCAFTEEILKKCLNSTESMSDTMGTGSMFDEELLNEVIGSMKDLEFIIWIDPQEEELYRVKLSMTEVMQKLMQKMLEKEDVDKDNNINISKMEMDIKYKNYDKAADFEIPKEAFEAQDISEIEDSIVQ